MASSITHAKKVIIPDSCSILFMAAPIPEEFFIDNPHAPNYVPEEKRPHTFLDLLLQLPRSQFKAIHITDVILAECVARRVSGAILYDMPEDKPNFTPTMHFLYPAMRKHYAHLEGDFVKKFNLRESNLYLDFLEFGRRAVKTAKEMELRQGITRESEQITKYRNLTTAIHNRFGKDYGEISMAQHARTLTDPVLFISDDHAKSHHLMGLRKIISVCMEGPTPKENVEGVTTRRFIEMLQAQGVLTQMGIKNTIQPADIIKTMAMFDQPDRRSFTGKYFESISVTPATIRSEESRPHRIDTPKSLSEDEQAKKEKIKAKYRRQQVAGRNGDHSNSR